MKSSHSGDLGMDAPSLFRGDRVNPGRASRRAIRRIEGALNPPGAGQTGLTDYAVAFVFAPGLSLLARAGAAW